MSLTFERFYPWLFGASAALIGWLLQLSLPVSDENRFTALLSSSISVSAILVGFLATMKSILMAVPGVIERLRKLDYLGVLSLYLIEGTIANLFFCVLNVTYFFPWVPDNPAIVSVLWIGTGVLSVCSFWRVVHVMILIMQMKTNP